MKKLSDEKPLKRPRTQFHAKKTEWKFISNIHKPTNYRQENVKVQKNKEKIKNEKGK